MMVCWSVLGCVLLIAAIVVIVRMQGAALGPYSTRLLNRDAIGQTISGLRRTSCAGG